MNCARMCETFSKQGWLQRLLRVLDSEIKLLVKHNNLGLTQ